MKRLLLVSCVFVAGCIAHIPPEERAMSAAMSLCPEPSNASHQGCIAEKYPALFQSYMQEDIARRQAAAMASQNAYNNYMRAQASQPTYQYTPLPTRTMQQTTCHRNGAYTNCTTY